MSEVRHITNPAVVADSSPDVAPLRLAPADYQSGSAESTVATTASATDALVRGQTLPSLTLTDNGSSAEVTGASEGSSVQVRPGDSLWRIAREALTGGNPDGAAPSNRDILAAVNAIARENQLANPDLIHPGDVIRLPQELARGGQSAGVESARAERSTETAAAGDGQAPKVRAEAHHVTGRFATEMQANFASLPKSIRDLLAQSGHTIVATEKMSLLDPSAAGTRAEQQSGAYDSSRKAMILAETHFDPTTGAYARDDNSNYTFRRVAGRAVDNALGNISQSDEFKRAFESDIAALNPEKAASYAALAQGGDAGRAEVFAELFAMTNGDAKNTDESLNIYRDFANSKRAMQARLAQIE